MNIKLANLYPPVFPRLLAYLRQLILPFSKISCCLPREGKILDLGCGSGLTTLYFATQHPKCHFVGTDVNHVRINLAKSVSTKFKNVQFVTQNLFGKNHTKYDVIIAIDLFHHLPAAVQKQFFLDAKNNLTSAGQLIIKEMDTKPRFKYLFNALHDKLAYPQKPAHYFSSTVLSTLLISAGFNIIKHQDISNIFYSHYLYVATL